MADRPQDAPATARARWLHVAAAFDAVVEAPAGERDAVLAARCGADAGLRAEVEALLRSLDRDDDFLDAPASHFIAEEGEGADDDPPLPVGSRIGPFRIVREIGRGGMGAVFLAEREDPALRQRVAIKLMRPGRRSEFALQRFVEERRILASLDHPDIARLVDGGVTRDDTPWFAMEYVDGEPLDRHCSERGASVEERITLFCRICDTVQYAHRQLVVHRDLKPSNILVTADGQPKLLDFGVARLLGGPVSDTAAGAGDITGTTAPWLRAITPAFASPEQLRGEPASTASDVYALGVVLHLILTGSLPRQAAAADGGATPATAALDHELAAIVRKAMHPSPDARYPTADQLAGDLRRHLRGLPVGACRDTRWYRARKFVGRHRGSVTLSLLAFVLLAGSSIVTMVQSRRLAAERDRASAVEAFLSTLLTRADPRQATGAAPTVRELLDRGARQLADGTPAAPEVRARLFLALGRAYHGLGDYDRAIALVDSSYRLHQALHGADAPEAIAVANQLADVLRMRGRHADARALYRVILDARRAAYGERSTEVARSLNGLAMVLRMQGEYEEAESLLRRALAIDRERRNAEPAALTQTLNNLGHVMRDRGALSEAEALHRESLAARRAVWGEGHFEVSVSLSNLAEVLRDRGELAGADSVYREALALRHRLVGEAHPDLAADRAGYARLLHLTGESARAESLYRRALAVQERALPAEHAATATTRYRLGILLAERGRDAEARRLLEDALAARALALPVGDPKVTEVRAELERIGRR